MRSADEMGVEDSQLPLRSVGDLGQTPSARLLWDLAKRQFTGTLIVRGPESAGAMHGESLFAFEEGKLAQAQIPQPVDTLGVVLFEEGVITRAQLDDSLARVAAEEGLQGAVLVSIGACDRAAIERGLKAQLRRKVLRLFSLGRAPFEAHSDIDLLEDFGGRRFPIDIADLLWDGVRADPDHPSVHVAFERLGPRWFRLFPDATAAELFAPGSLERKLLERVKRPARLSDLVDLGASIPIARAFVALLAMTRQIECVRAREPSQAANDDGFVPSISSPFIAAVSVPPLRPPSIPAPEVSASGPLVRPSAPPFVFGVNVPQPANDTGRASPIAEDPEAARKAGRLTELQQGEQHLRHQRFVDAERSARVVLLKDGGDVEALLLLANALLEQRGAAKLEEVKKCVTTVLAAAPENDRAFTVAARMYRATGDEKRAFTCFTRAYKLNPRNIDAMREIRLANMRRRNDQAAPEPEGFFARLFGARG